MAKIKKSARKFYEEAREVQGASSQVIREFQSLIKPELSSIERDPNLSPTGKKAKMDELKKEYGIRILQQANTMKQKYLTKLEKARVSADATIHAGLKKPDDEMVNRFNKSFNQLKVELMLTPRAETAKQKLTEFMAGIQEPYFANQIRESFADVAGNILSAAGPEKAKYQMELAQLFEKLESDHSTPEVAEAREVLRYVEQAQASPTLFGGFIAADAVTGLVGKEYADHLNSPEAWFAQQENAEHKPADFVDTDSDFEETEEQAPKVVEMSLEEAFRQHSRR
ncbi:hypothetical protein [Fictibacillus terranigra]|uniref:Uncharacterized protein n=1 Tax=Fictibacillus terranigra TaxID=3058424 RepID=A0ABT8E6U2_9BACL|nr:hypothetical protein [Fictibacillus sp. CENA-BCM004]MDN4073626.1 hypothetical protein [Fictibacillus sp. CENA-BCM004]